MLKMKRTNFPAILAIAILLLATASPGRAQLPADQMTTLTLPDPKPNWVYILDTQFPANMLQKIWIMDGETRKILGTIYGGYQGNFEISPDHREMYMIDTYYSRGWHGDRTDVVTIFDAHTAMFSARWSFHPSDCSSCRSAIVLRSRRMEISCWSRT